MPGGAAELHYDDSPIYKDKHHGPAGLTIRKEGANFLSCGVSLGAAVYNETAGTNGHIAAITDDTILTDIAWSFGDTFSVYITATKGSLISYINTDLRFGTKVTRKDELNERGQLLEDEDYDEVTRNIFGPGEPWPTR
jgi:hypothetical protein